MTELHNRRCLACEGGVRPMSQEEILKHLAQVSSWELDETATKIYRRFTFKNFHQTMAFVNAVAWIAHRENHHPDMVVSYNSCLLEYSTHAMSGLSVNDFICAAKINGLTSI